MLLVAAVVGALDTATDLEAVTVAIPAISAGIYGYPVVEATQLIAETAAAFFSEEDSLIRSVWLVGYDDATADQFASALDSMIVSL